MDRKRLWERCEGGLRARARDCNLRPRNPFHMLFKQSGALDERTSEGKQPAKGLTLAAWNSCETIWFFFCSSSLSGNLAWIFCCNGVNFCILVVDSNCVTVSGKVAALTVGMRQRDVEAGRYG